MVANVKRRPRRRPLNQLRFAVLPISLLLCQRAHAADDISGLWVDQNRDGQIEIVSCGTQTMCGRIVSILDVTLPPTPRDALNENAELRNRPICGLEVLGDLKKDGASWNGWVYDPHRGKVFQVDIKLADGGTLMVH